MRIIDYEVINALKSQGYKPRAGNTLRYWKKSELIEQINILEHNWGCEIIAHNRGVKYAEDLLKKQGWHYPSRGELPPNGGDYLVCIEYEDREYIRVGQYFGETGWYTDLGEVYGYWTPTAWMPLPEPPKEEA